MHIRVRMEEYGDGQNQEFSLVGTKVNHRKGGNKLPLYFHKNCSLLNMVYLLTEYSRTFGVFFFQVRENSQGKRVF